MKNLLIYLKDYKKETVFGPLFKLLEASFELLVPLVMADIIDVGIANADKRYIVKMCLVMVALGIIGLACSITAQYFAAKAAVGFSTKLRHSLFKHIQSLSFSEMDDIGTSTMITRMTSDINQVQSGVNMVLRLFLRSPFIVFGAMIMAFTIDVKAALVFVVVIPLLSVVVFAIMAYSIPLYKKVQAALDNVLGITRENLTGVRVIRAFNKENEEIEKFGVAHDNLTGLQMFVGKVTAIMNPGTYIIINAGILALIYAGAIRVDAGYITQGQVVALVNYMSQILVELIKLANLIITVTKALACANRISSVLEIESTMNSPENPVKPGVSEYAVEFDNVSLRYNSSGEEALSNIDFKVKKGETVGIIGGTGSGKSSVVNMIPRFYDAFSGEVKVNGVNVKDYDMKDLRERVGIVLQKAVLFKGTIRENLMWGNDSAIDADIEKAIAASQSKEFVDNKEGRLDYMISQGGKNLSGGQKQRLTIARAIVKNPEILILDDSASALDYATDAALRKSIRELENNPTVFIVSQRTSSIRSADKIVVLDDGKIVGKGTHDELLNTCDIYREINDSQQSAKA
ncbi:MAG: ABC transporter ATP-binding protein/permease [Lachnospiraceae bacterium]|nr:ABC transporter ATP-binding protein/permease [Lachnospiraceae bacterium]